MKDSPQSPRVIRVGHHKDGPEPMIDAPSGKDVAFTLRSDDIGRDSLGLFHSERSKLANQDRGLVFVRESAAEELAFDGVGRVAEYRDSCRHPAMHEIGCLQSAGAARVDRHDDDVDGLGLRGHDQKPPGRPKNRLTKEHDSNRGQARQRQGSDESSRARRPIVHNRMIAGLRGCRLR